MSKSIAYSYIRFSSAEQAKGDSARRQLSAAIAYCHEHGLELDNSLRFQDLGVSAFTGKNAETGRLGDFLRAVESGVVAQGSYLIVENLDRLSRQSARKAMTVLGEIVDSGVSVVTLSDGKTYTKSGLDGNPLDLMLALLSFVRANEESAIKGRRVSAAWKQKRAKAAERPLTARCPAWLRLRPDRSGFDVVAERAAIVREVYEMAARGVGQNSIAADLNRRGIPTWGDSTRRAAAYWHRSYIVKMLSSDTVIGTFTPHTIAHEDGKKVRIPSEPVPGYYPAVVDLDTYYAAQARRLRADDGTGGFRGRSVIRSILAGLARCPLCGTTMTRKTQSARQLHATLVCRRARIGAGCSCRGVRLAPIEDAFLAEAAQTLYDVGAGYADTATDPTLELLRDRRRELEQARDNLIAELEQGRASKAISQRIAQLEDELEEIGRELEERLSDIDRRSAAFARSRLEQAVSDMRQLARTRAVLASSETPEDKQVAAAERLDEETAVVNGRLHEVLSNVVVQYQLGKLELHWKFGESTEFVYDWPAYLASDATSRPQEAVKMAALLRK